MKTKYALWNLFLVLVLLWAPNTRAGLFGPKGDNPDEKKANVRKQQDEMLADLYHRKPELKETIRNAAGCATFKNVNVNLLLVATANGYGVVVDNKSGKETFMRMASLGGGMEIYQFTESGIALQATVAGTKYWKDAKLNQPPITEPQK